MPPKAKLKKEVETNLVKKRPGRKPKATAIEPNQQTLNFSPKPIGIGSASSANSHIGRSVGLTVYSPLYFEQYSNIEHSCWAILPSSVLDRFQNEIFDRSDKSNNNACFKIINGELEIYVCALEFTANEKEIIIPSHMLDYLAIEPGSQVVVTLVDPPQASNMRLMPLDKQFFNVEDTSDLLETSIKNYYKVLVEGQIIECRYFDLMIKMKIESLEPYYVCRTNETDLNIDFLENPQFIEKPEPVKQTNTGSSWDSEKVVNSEDSYFSKLGKGNSIVSASNASVLSADEVRRKRLERLSTK